MHATNGQFSPDGKWIAYSSPESGRVEIYVAPVSGQGGRTMCRRLVESSRGGGETAKSFFISTARATQ